MTTYIKTRVTKESSAVFTASFTDEDGAAVVPNAGLVWSLTDANGTIVNSREDVTLTPASSVVIKLTGDDLAIADDDLRERRLVIAGTYASGGDTLTIRGIAVFELDDE